MPFNRPPRFSQRVPAVLTPSDFSLRIDALKKTDEGLLDLTESNPTQVEMQRDTSYLLACMGLTEARVYEPVPQGLIHAREAIADYYARRGSPRPDPERIFLTTSTSEAYSLLGKLLADPGDAFYVPRPSYPLFEHLLQLEVIRPIYYSSHYLDRWTLELPGPDRLDPRARALIVVNPNNPTGAYVSPEELEALHTFCAEHGLALISDEVFSDYPMIDVLQERVETLADYDRVLTFSLSGFSKVLGFPQLKLGWILINGPQEQVEEARARLEFIADQYLSVGTPIQHAVCELLPIRAEYQGPIWERIYGNRHFLLEEALRCPWVTPLRTEGGWYQVLHVPRFDSEEAMVTALLEQDNVLVHPGYFFDMESEGYLIVSLLPMPEVFYEGITRLFARIRRWAEA